MTTYRTALEALAQGEVFLMSNAVTYLYFFWFAIKFEKDLRDCLGAKKFQTGDI